MNSDDELKWPHIPLAIELSQNHLKLWMPKDFDDLQGGGWRMRGEVEVFFLENVTGFSGWCGNLDNVGSNNEFVFDVWPLNMGSESQGL